MIEDINSIEVQKDEINKIRDPQKFLEDFRSSTYYKEALNKFYEGKNIASDVTQEEQIEIFENVEAARQAMVRYSEGTNSILKYDPGMYTKDFCETFGLYTGLIKDIKEGNFPPGPESIIALDRLRSSYHMNAAVELVRQGITKSTKLARGLIELMTIEKGLENFSNVSVSEIDKLRIQLASRQEQY